MASPALTVLLLGNYENDEQTSMLQFATSLEEGLTREGIKVQKIRPEAFFGRLKRSPTGLGKWLGYLDKFLLFPIALGRALKRLRNAGAPFVVHICDHSNAHYTRYLQEVPHLVTCNDLLAVRSALGEFPVNPTRWTGRILQSLILNGLRRARHITSISEATRQDVLRVVGLPAERTSVTYMGFNANFGAPPADEAAETVRQVFSRKGGERPAGYVFHVGSNAWYKNRPGVIRMYRSLRQLAAHVPPLVFAGKPLSPELQALVRESGLESAVVDLGSVSHRELCALYSQATLLVFPSLEEGFGWPVIEAQACGCPVATTAKAPMTEIGGDAAVYLPPGDEAASAQALKRLLEESAEAREKRIAAGHENVSRFSTAEMIGGYRKLYEAALAGYPGTNG